MSQSRWGKAVAAWLGTARRNSEHTERSYRRSIEDLMGFLDIGPEDLGTVGGADVAEWANELAESGLAKSTIATRLAGVSSVYEFARSVYTDGAGQPLTSYNPVDGVDRPQVNPYGKSRPLGTSEIGALLAQIDRSTVVGLRDYALILFAVYTGKRSHEARNLRAGDIQPVAEQIRFFWRGKRDKSGWADLPAPVWQAIQLYWAAAGQPGPGDPVFGSHNGQENGPLSGVFVNMMVQEYALHAGLRGVTFHTLRHSAALLRKRAGQSVADICQMLGHSRLDTTQVYLGQVEGFVDTGWQSVAEMLAEAGVQSA